MSEGRCLVEEAISDYGRITPSPAFRRLQAKAQVFSLEANDGVRTRLTHTLEVAMYGKILANKIFSALLDMSTADQAGGERLAFISFVESACLIHDLGNPPFGHFGEFTIREWFEREFLDETSCLSKIPTEHEAYHNDFKCFDGNAQGFRIVSRLSWVDDGYGLNLTATTILGSLKYLTKKDGKLGFFETEKERLEEAQSILNTKDLRSPIVCIMETCDDIANGLSDIEDGIEKGLISFNEIESFVNESMHAIAISILEDVHKDEIDLGEKSLKGKVLFTKFKIKLVRHFINSSAETFVKNKDGILSGKYDKNLLDGDDARLFKELRNFATEKLFRSKEAIDLEIVANAVINSLLDGFRPLLRLDSDKFSKVMSWKGPYGKSELEKRLCFLLPKRHKQVYFWQLKEGKHPEIVLRIHLILDYIAGMTDAHALHVSQMLSGITAKIRA